MSSEKRAKQLDQGYWYKDDDCNNYINAVINSNKLLGGRAENKRYLLKNTSQENGKNWHVLVTDTVNGQTNVPEGQRRVDYYLDHRKQPDANKEILQFIISHKSFAELSDKNVDNFLNNICTEMKLEVSTNLNPFKEILKNTKYNKVNLKKYIKENDETLRAINAAPVDVFHDIEDLLKDHQERNFKILFDCNLGNHIEGKGIGGSHWITGEIQIVKQANGNCNISVLGHDPMGGDSMSEDNRKRILKAVSDRLLQINEKILTTESKEISAYKNGQNDAASCGVIASEGVVMRAQGKSLDTEYPSGALELRKKQIQVIGGKIILSDEEFSSKSPNSKWTKFAQNTVKPIFDKIFKGQSKLENGKTSTKCKNCDIEYSDGKIIATGEPDNETLKNMLEAMIEIKKSAGAEIPISITVDTTPKNPATENAVLELARKYKDLVVVKAKGKVVVDDVVDDVVDAVDVNKESYSMRNN